MCLVAIAIEQSRRFPLVVAANRDEFLDRPAARLAWWSPAGGGAPILGGRDLDAGGTWLGLNLQGRFALLTNVRDPLRQDASAPSRGRIVPDWLAARERSDRFWMRTALSGYNPFNLVAADLAAGECFWASNDASPPQRLERRLYGISNARLGMPWPKVQALQERMREALSSDSIDLLCQSLFASLADRTLAADTALPRTGISLDLERALSPAFVRTPDGRYGTRCSTLVVSERVGRTMVTHMIERSFDAAGMPALQRHATLRHWPPRDGAASPAEAGPVTECDANDPLAVAPSRRRRKLAASA
jgi:uncharacterized protein with NRDE domain